MNKLKCKLIVILIISNKLLLAQGKDTTFFYDYYISANLLSRIGQPFDVGIERIKPIKKNISYASQIAFYGSKEFLGIKTENVWYPKYAGFFIQPFHLLMGKQLKFETGISAAFQLYGFSKYKYPIDTSNNAYNLYSDRYRILYTIGLRYVFKKPQISVKLILGPSILLTKNFVNSKEQERIFRLLSFIEFGFNYRLRKHIIVSIKH